LLIYAKEGDSFSPLLICMAALKVAMIMVFWELYWEIILSSPGGKI